ncbi:hypothetical protein GALMADRAFT_253670 [Galerina marginata CBS 339.88]|uniref:Uncharacterized protein n=1 Tax=Galerina marginata (strain CBS 339.88) TaxID=685588 RepID=A0A067SW24_GALM3|nr:hypothetical protein GALMADRAFT_253670 [Galerina marginata CBS 339.88]
MTSTLQPSPSIASDLPLELLYEIFDHVCAPPPSLAALPRVGGRHLGPLWLGRICKRWRDVASALPFLWTYIHLVPSSDRYDAQVEILEEYLRRSKNLPLTIVFTIRTTNTDEYCNNRSRPLYELIAQECHRWEVIDIFIPHLCVPHMNATCLHLPLLRSASVEALREEFPLHFIQNAPLLSDLALGIFTLPNLDKPFHHLTHFSAFDLNSGDVLQALKLAPNLRSCFIEHLQRPWPDAIADPLYVKLEHLESFTILDSSSMDAQASLFNYIAAAPALQEFRCTARPEGLLPLGLIVDLMDRAQCRLETLELKTKRLGRLDTGVLLEGLLRCTTTLSSLVLHYDGTTAADKFVTNISELLNPLSSPVPPLNAGTVVSTVGGDSPVLLPDLLNLELLFPQVDSFSPILTMLKNRWEFGTPLIFDLSSSESPSSGKQFTKIMSAHLPEWCRPAAMVELADQIKDGFVMDFI